MDFIYGSAYVDYRGSVRRGICESNEARQASDEIVECRGMVNIYIYHRIYLADVTYHASTVTIGLCVLGKQSRYIRWVLVCMGVARCGA